MEKFQFGTGEERTYVIIDFEKIVVKLESVKTGDVTLVWSSGHCIFPAEARRGFNDKNSDISFYFDRKYFFCLVEKFGLDGFRNPV